MKREQWETFKLAACGQKPGHPPMALIIDSPWIPGFLGISHLDYYLDPETWFQANLQIMRQFPDVIMFPSWWVEYGMAAEPSVLGAKIRFWPDQTPSEEKASISNINDLEKIARYDINTDSFAALTLHRIRMQKQRIFDEGYVIPAATARGPLCTASFVRGVNELMMDIFEQPEFVTRLLDITTALTIDWLKAQTEAIGDCVEGIFILDDIVGFLSEDQYLTFAHPCLKRICEAFPPDWIKVYHNDANVSQCLPHLPDAGFDVLNWGKQLDIESARQVIGDKMCLMGNVNPLEIGVRGTPEQMREETKRVLEASGGKGLILSLGGGVSPGMPAENIKAMIDAWREYR